jgi:hypothetical protein
LVAFGAAAAVYAGFAIYLYQPYFKHFTSLEYLVVLNSPMAALGCFLLSRRWVGTFWGSLFAGAVYGFGPLVLGFAKFHPTAGLLAAGMPWFFCPAAFCNRTKWRWMSLPLLALPFLGVLLFFQATVGCRLFAVSTQAKLHSADLAGLLAPLVAVTAKRSSTLLGFYHTPIAALVVGISMLLAARRFAIIIIFVIGTVLAACDSFLNISPVVWLTVPVLCCSVLIGMGTQGLASAGLADRKWVLLSTAVTGALAITTLLLATKYFQTFLGWCSGYAELFAEAGKMFLLGTIATGIIFFMARAKLRLTRLRLVILCSAMALDIFWGARFIVDRLL